MLHDARLTSPGTPRSGLAAGDTRTPFSDYFAELSAEVYRLTRIDDANFVMLVAEILGVSPAHWYASSLRESEGVGVI